MCFRQGTAGCQVPQVRPSPHASCSTSARLVTRLMMTPAARTVVFDLDHTLIRCDSFAGFSQYMLWRQWWRLLLVLVISPLVAALWISRRTRLYAVSTLVWCGTVGMDEHDLFRRMDRYVAKRFEDPTLVCQGA